MSAVIADVRGRIVGRAHRLLRSYQDPQATLDDTAALVLAALDDAGGPAERLRAGEGPELEEITTFDEGPLGADWAEQFEARGIRVTRDVLRDEALAVFRDYRKAVDTGGVTVYNARGGTE
ncbi:hypothetical protein [Nonomuraea sp. NPDC003201]